MNTVCAAGFGSFLDRQASRLGIPIDEFGKLALSAKNPVRIAGRCAVFAESDMVHKQQTGHSVQDIVAGLCRALVRNYLNNLAKGKNIAEPVVFQGGVAANEGIVDAFEKELGLKIIVPEYYDVMGAYGAAVMTRAKMAESGTESSFKGFEIASKDYATESFDCGDCANHCEIIEIKSVGEILAAGAEDAASGRPKYLSTAVNNTHRSLIYPSGMQIILSLFFHSTYTTYVLLYLILAFFPSFI